MHKLAGFVSSRSKPAGGEQSYLLSNQGESTTASYHTGDHNMTTSDSMPDSISNPNFKLGDNYNEFSASVDTDLQSYNAKTRLNRIDEWQAAWNVTNAIQGMFVVSLPYAVANGGYWALLAMLVVAYVCCYTGKILVDCLYDDDDDHMVDFFDMDNTKQKKMFNYTLDVCISKRKHRVRSTYVDIAKDVWGSHFGAGVVNLAQNIELLMTCILYLVLCGDLFVGSFPNSPLDHSSWTMISTMILVPCAFINSLTFVSRLSFYNAIVHLIINAIIVLYCLTKFSDWDFSKVELKINIWSFPISLGIIVFSYTSQIFLPTMEGSMVDRSKFNSMLNSTHLVAAIFKAAFGYVGFLTWQEKTDEVITNNLDSSLKVLVNMILVVKALLSYPLPYFASVELLESTLFLTDENFSTYGGEHGGGETQSNKRRKSTQVPSKSLFSMTCYEPDGDLKFWAVCLRIGLIIFTLFLAVFIPHFAILMGLIGSITGTMLSLIWPCYFHLHLKYKRLKWYQIALDCAIIAFGVLISVTGIYYSSIALVKAIRNENPFNNPDYYKKNNFFNMGNATVTSEKTIKVLNRKHSG